MAAAVAFGIIWIKEICLIKYMPFKLYLPERSAIAAPWSAHTILF